MGQDESAARLTHDGEREGNNMSDEQAEEVIRQLEESWQGTGLEDPKYSSMDSWEVYNNDQPVYAIRMAFRTITPEGVLRTSVLAPWLFSNKEVAADTMRILLTDGEAAQVTLQLWSNNGDLPLPDGYRWECVGLKGVRLTEIPF
jgi:hypothetical protein